MCDGRCSRPWNTFATDGIARIDGTPKAQFDSQEAPLKKQTLHPPPRPPSHRCMLDRPFSSTCRLTPACLPHTCTCPPARRPAGRVDEEHDRLVRVFIGPQGLDGGAWRELPRKLELLAERHVRRADTREHERWVGG